MGTDASSMGHSSMRDKMDLKVNQILSLLSCLKNPEKLALFCVSISSFLDTDHLVFKSRHMRLLAYRLRRLRWTENSLSFFFFLIPPQGGGRRVTWAKVTFASQKPRAYRNLGWSLFYALRWKLPGVETLILVEFLGMDDSCPGWQKRRGSREIRQDKRVQ